jgi:hypothetical protein
MLSTDKGATLEELTGARGWLPHTARAALTGLCKRGYDVHLVRGDRETAAVYRMTTQKPGARGDGQRRQDPSDAERAAERKSGRLRSRPGLLVDCGAAALRRFGAASRSVGFFTCR